MIDLTFLNHYAPVWILVIMTVLVFGALKILKIPGTPIVMFIVSLLVAFIFVSSKTMISFVIEIIPILTVLLVLGFFILIALVFMTKDIATFAKPLGWTIFILSLIFIVGSAFGSFAPLEHMLPHTSDAHLNEGLEQLKDFIYSSAFKDGIIFVISVIVVGFFLLKK